TLLSQCYVQGSTAVVVSNSTGTILNSNTLVATQVDGSGLWAKSSGNVNLSLSSNTFFGGPQGAGVYLDQSNAGSIYLTTNTIVAGSQYGIYLAAQPTAPTLYITSNTILPLVSNARNTYGIYINGLTTGATIENNGIYYRNSGSMGTN